MAKTKQEWALILASRGLPIIRLHYMKADGTCSCGRSEDKCKPGNRGKHPVEDAWQATATTDPEKIKSWFKTYPNMNYGMVANESTYFVDIDTKNGSESFDAAADLLGVPVDQLSHTTFTVQTPSGGQHLYFKADKKYGNSVGTLAKGVDTRSGNGFVVGPGSTRYVPDEFDPDTLVEVAYEVINDVEPIAIPEKLQGRLVEAQTRVKDHDETLSDASLDSDASVERAIQFLKHRKPAVAGQGGNSHTLNTAMSVRDVNISEEKCYELMLEHWNDTCDPPWEASELQGIVGNAYRYANRKIGSKGGGLIDALLEDTEVYGESKLPPDFYDDEPEAIAKRTQTLTEKFERATHNAAGVLLVNKHYDFIIDQWLPAKNYSIMLGGRGSGKTTILVDMVCHIASDEPWHKTLVDPGWHVIYIAGEDFPGVKERYEAWCRTNKEKCVYDHATEHYNIKDPNRIQFVDMAIDLMKEEEVAAFIKFVKSKVEKIFEGKSGPRKIMFVLDTWQRMTAAAEGGQSSDESMQKALNHLEAMAESFDGPCIIAAHPPKANKDTMAGSAIIENRSDAIWSVDDTLAAKMRRTTVTRIKGAPSGNFKVQQFDNVTIAGKTSFGRQRRSLVARYIKGTIDSVENQDITEAGYSHSQAMLLLLRDILAKKQAYNPRDTRKPSMKNICSILMELPMDKTTLIETQIFGPDDTGERDPVLRDEWLGQLREMGFTDKDLEFSFTGKNQFSENVMCKAVRALQSNYSGKAEIGKTGYGIVWVPDKRGFLMTYDKIKSTETLDSVQAEDDAKKLAEEEKKREAEIAKNDEDFGGEDEI